MQRGLFTQPDSDTQDSDLIATSEKPEISRRSTSSRADSHARTSALRARAQVWPASEAAFSFSSYEYWKSLGLRGSSLRTSMRSCRSIPAGTWESFSPRWLSAGIASHGGFSTAAFSDSPNDAHECSLSDIQLTGEVPQRFFLSPRAAKGILRRARKRGVIIREPILSALLRLAAAAVPERRMRVRASLSEHSRLAMEVWTRMTSERVASFRHSFRAARKELDQTSVDSSSCMPAPLKVLMQARMDQGAVPASLRTPRSHRDVGNSDLPAAKVVDLQSSSLRSSRAHMVMVYRQLLLSSQQPFAEATRTEAEAMRRRKPSPSSSVRTNEERSEPLISPEPSATGGGYQDRAISLRRLIPIEWERLQGFPDHWTCVRNASEVLTLPDIEGSVTPSPSRSLNGSFGGSTP
jgi:hypothetical protein